MKKNENNFITKHAIALITLVIFIVFIFFLIIQIEGDSLLLNIYYLLFEKK